MTMCHDGPTSAAGTVLNLLGLDRAQCTISDDVRRGPLVIIARRDSFVRRQAAGSHDFHCWGQKAKSCWWRTRGKPQHRLICRLASREQGGDEESRLH